MSDSPLTAADIRAAAEVHGELGPDYHDAVVESFLAKIDKKIEARVDERLAAVAKPRSLPVNQARLSKYRIALAGAAGGSVVVGMPMTVIAAHAMAGYGGGRGLVWIWVVLLAVYGLAAYRLRRR